MSIDLGTQMRVAGVMLQGRNANCDCSQWLTRVKIDTSNDNLNWILHGEFAGSTDADSKIQLFIQNPMVARFVRISVVSISGHASARWDVLTTTDQTLLVAAQPRYLRYNPSINQYAFSSCWSGDAPGSGHCRPMLDSPQVPFCDAAFSVKCANVDIFTQGWSSQQGSSGW